MKPRPPPSGCGDVSGPRLHADVGQCEVVVDTKLVDGSEVCEPVFEFQQVRVVDSDFKLAVGAKDLNLQIQESPVIMLWWIQGTTDT